MERWGSASFAPAAHSVHLVGDFNRWSLAATPMRRMKAGWWRCQLRLDPGVYRFKYYADGKWYHDDGAFGLEPGPLGDWNSRLWVSAQRTAEEASEGSRTASIDVDDAVHRTTKFSLAVRVGSAA